MVLELTKKLWHKGYHLYFDNFYTSPSLYTKLFNCGMGTCGTVRLNRRGIPKPFQTAKLRRGEMTSFQDGGVKWMDKRPVTVLSTIHDTSMSSISRRSRQAPGGIENIQKPTIIAEYNLFMGGVDKADQLVTYYGFSHYSKKWWKRAFFHLLDTTIVNSYLVYCSTVSSQRLSHVDFKLAVAQGLIEMSEFPQPVRPQDAAHTPAHLIGRDHFPEPGGKRDCKVCSRREAGEKRKQTGHKCCSCKDATLYSSMLQNISNSQELQVNIPIYVCIHTHTTFIYCIPSLYHNVYKHNSTINSPDVLFLNVP